MARFYPSGLGGLAKEMKAGSGGRITTSSGEIAKVSSADFAIQNGKFSLGDAGSRRLADGIDSDATVATTQARVKGMLSSSLPDSAFDALNEIKVLSDRGHKFGVQVHGYSRVPVLNSRCGNIVTMYTAWGGKVILDGSQLSFDEATAEAFGNAGFSVAGCSTDTCLKCFLINFLRP